MRITDEPPFLDFPHDLGKGNLQDNHNSMYFQLADRQRCKLR